MGGKSYLGSWWILTSCLKYPGIRAGLGRKTLKSLKASTLNTLLTIMKDEIGLEKDVNYNYNEVSGEITFWNDSKILLLELATLPSDQEFSRFGSSEFSCIFVDECNEMDEKCIDVLFSRIRWKTHKTFKVSKMLLSTNPDTNWVRDRFVQDKNGDPIICRKYEKYIPFSLFDNPDDAFRATYEASLRMMGEKEKQRLLYGNWDFVQANDAAFYNQFKGEKHLVSGLKEKYYDAEKPLILSFDFNCHPYNSCLVSQIDYENKKVYFFEELLGYPKDKRNNTPELAKYIYNKLRRIKHNGTFVVTGDPSGLARSTQTTDGVNNFSIIRNGLRGLNIKQRLMNIAPNQIVRGEFINAIFGDNYEGWNIFIDLKCRRLTDDLIYQLSEQDGSKSKAKVKDPNTGVKYEKYGHLSDCMDLTLCLFLQKEWYKYKRGGIEGNQAPITSNIPAGFSY